MPLRNLRRTRTFNQQTFASLVGIGQQYLSKIERGLVVPSVDVQSLIAAVLGVSRADVFPGQVAAEERERERGAA